METPKEEELLIDKILNNKDKLRDKVEVAKSK